MIQTGMVLSIDIPVFNTIWGGFRFEDGYYITDNGAELLNKMGYVILK